ncbi:cytochrome c3 family protein [Bdellovibrionota bacterium FG-2]
MAKKGQTVRFSDQSTRSVYVDREHIKKSVHAAQLECTDCHRDITASTHPTGAAKNAKFAQYKDARDFSIQLSNTCQRCHYAYYTRMLDSIHFEIMKAGERSAPICTDCHGSHDVRKPGNPRKEINTRCRQCHTEVAKAYEKSVHGELLATGSDDAPVCTDCHGAHAISDPTKPGFKAASYKLCAKCHGDEKKMQPHGLNPAVLSSYLDDFHGASNRLYTKTVQAPKSAIATCVDCHGTHDIQRFRANAGGASLNKEQMRERVVKTCRKCHDKVPAAFADAWLSHYPATLKSAPQVWAVKWLYRIMIPLIMLGLVSHSLLHLWRIKTKKF